MVHPAPHDGPRPTENPSGPVHDPDGVAVPIPTPTANDKDKSSGTNKGPRHQKPVSHGGPIREAQPRREGPRIHRYSPLGVPKPGQTARVVRMVERAQREFEKNQPPYHSKHARPAIPTQEAMQSLQMGYQTMGGMVGDGIPEWPPSRLPGQSKHRPSMVGNPTVVGNPHVPVVGTTPRPPHS